ncbi:helix-turn-helix domain-containing protein [Paraburkholderia nemoris]|uniref:helix-turn-helix domain-containing protein n=1 Tax=Paraburkholderia nemoris TaxID=2793076 RepID=UPI001B21FB06|nr:helix-turn-helix domain-containing protein [Paraburkholderia nemoris]CAE6849032.1 hypothetical protein LMG22931_07607 [Paraburkholderia nemoris]
MTIKTDHVSLRIPLPPMQPIGANTARSEKLTAYLTRIALAMHVPAGRIVQHMMTGSAGQQYADAFGDRQRHDLANSHGVCADAWAEGLNKLTGRYDLDELTLLRWRPLFGKRSQLTTVGRRWCPRCLEEDLKARRVVYERLIWSIEPVKICPWHGCQLKTICHACGRIHRYELTVRQVPGFCSYCHAWLGNSTIRSEMRPNPNDAYDSFVARTFEELLDLSVEIDRLAGQFNYAKTLHNLLTKTGATQTSLSKMLELSVSTVSEWLTGSAVPSPRNTVNICYCFHISLTDFMTNRLTGCHSHALAELPPGASGTRKKGHHRRHLNWPDIKAYLDAINTHDAVEISVEAIARKFGVASTQIRFYFPEECRIASQICAKHRKMEQSKARAIHDTQLKAAVETEIWRLVRLGRPPIPKRIMQTMIEKRLATDKRGDRHIIAASCGQLLHQ